MKNICFFIFGFLLLFSGCKDKNEQLEIFEKYDKVRLLSYNKHRYAYRPENELKIIDNKMNFHDDIKFIDDLILNEQQKEKILTIISTDHANNENCSVSDCYMPRHILLFYKNNKLIDFYEICAECGGIRKSVGLNKLSVSFCSLHGEALIRVFKEMKLKNNGEDDGETYKYY